MEKENWVKGAADYIRNALFEKKSVDASVFDDTIRINIKKLFIVSIIAMPVSLVHVTLFILNTQADDENEIKWRSAIIVSHIILCCLIGALGLLTFFLRKTKKVNRLMRLLPALAVLIILSFGIVFVSFDQWITTNITPFLVASIIAGTVVLMRPSVVFAFYSAAYLGYYYAIGLTQMDDSILLSNRVNGLSIIGIGVGLSIVLWRANITRILQEKFILKQQEQLKQKNKELEYLAYHDQMTGLKNRNRFEEILKNEIARIKRYKHTSTIILLDIDHFKKVNDNFGHPVGDKVIRHIASILKKNVRETDEISRWGGEEFLICMPNTTLSGGGCVAEKLRRLIESKNMHVRGEKLQITASFGVAVLTAEENALEKAYRNVDKALYMAKDQGRNCVVLLKTD